MIAPAVPREAHGPRPGEPVAPAFAWAWLVLAAVAAVAVPLALGAAAAVLTIVWLAVAAVVLHRRGTPAALGLTRVARRRLVVATGLATAGQVALFALAEIVWHPYRELLALIRAADPPDSTFAWVIDHGTGWGLAGFAAYSLVVTMFAEEVVFRGAALTWLRPRGPAWALAGATVPFAAVQLIAASQLPIGAATGFLVIDTVLAVGVVGGVAALATRSIWPGLVAATVANTLVVAAVAG